VRQPEYKISRSRRDKKQAAREKSSRRHGAGKREEREPVVNYLAKI
jgi:hypothetical protein